MPACECGCGREAKNRFVNGHNSFVQKNAAKPLAERLANFEVDPVTGCHNWKGAVNENGYGRISVRNNRQWDLAYKVAWIEQNGPVPDGHHLHHVCENPLCIRAGEGHVMPVTPAWHINHHINECGLNVYARS